MRCNVLLIHRDPFWQFPKKAPAQIRRGEEMKLERRLKWVLGIIFVCLAALLTWYLLQGRRPESEKEVEGSKAPRISTQGEEHMITLDQATQTRTGIVTALPKPTTYREELQAYGMVLELQNLVDLRKNLLDLRKSITDLRSNLAVAKAQVEKASLSLEASRKQYERLKTLYEDSRNVSEKALQAGEVTWRSDEANVHAAEQGLRAAQEALRNAEETLKVLGDITRQQWGSVLARWLFEGSAAINRLFQGQDVLIQITLPSGKHVPSPPEAVSIQTPAGTVVSAHFVSQSPRTDPHIQGVSFFYVAPRQATLLSGMDVVAFLSIGSKVKGFFIPVSSIVWWQGMAWIYVQKNPVQFLRQEVATTNPVREGYFATAGFTGKDRIVVKGAQILLSEEFRPKIQQTGEKERER
jgi:hypothetical protein